MRCCRVGLAGEFFRSGEGGFDVNSAGTLTFNKSVGSNQTIDVAASADVILTDPKVFNGLVNLGAASFAGEPTGGGRIDLNGLAKVDSYSFKNDMLKLYDGNKVVDTLRMHNSDPDFFVTKTVAGVSIYGSSTPVNIGLPVHHDLVG